jgi:hypothetical protein
LKNVIFADDGAGGKIGWRRDYIIQKEESRILVDQFDYDAVEVLDHIYIKIANGVVNLSYPMQANADVTFANG